MVQVVEIIYVVYNLFIGNLIFPDQVEAAAGGKDPGKQHVHIECIECEIIVLCI